MVNMPENQTKPFVYTQLNGFKHCFLTPIILSKSLSKELNSSDLYISRTLTGTLMTAEGEPESDRNE